MSETLEFVEHYNTFAEDTEWYVFIPEFKEKISETSEMTHGRLLIGVIMESFEGKFRFFTEPNRMANVYYGSNELDQISNKIKELNGE